MLLRVLPNSVITITMARRKGPWWAVPLILLLILSLLPSTWGCKPVPKDKYNPMCEENESIAKICPLRLVNKCPNLLLSDFHTSQTSVDSHDSTNVGLFNWNSSVGVHGQSSIAFFFIGYISAIATMLAVQRCRQSKKHKLRLQDLLSQVAQATATTAQHAPAPARPTMVPLLPNARLQLGGGTAQGAQPTRGALPQLEYSGEFIPLT